MIAKSVLVIGGTKGIGRVIARYFEARDFRVSAVGRSRPWDPETTPAADVIVLAQRYRGVEHPWGGEFRASVTLTNDVLAWVGRVCSPGACVIVISSAAARVVLSEQGPAYHVAKASMEHLVRFHAVQLGPKGIRVNGIAPGATVKPESAAWYRDHPEVTDLYRDSCPLQRIGTAEDVANVALFLASDQASYLTGQTLVLDGGLSCVSQESLMRQMSAARELQVTQ